MGPRLPLLDPAEPLQPVRKAAPLEGGESLSCARKASWMGLGRNVSPLCGGLSSYWGLAHTGAGSCQPSLPRH